LNTTEHSGKRKWPKFAVDRDPVLRGAQERPPGRCRPMGTVQTLGKEAGSGFETFKREAF